MMKNVYSVGQVNTYIKNMFAQDFMMQRICVKGEVSNCKYHTSGHIYFTLKDAAGTLNAVMFAGYRRGIRIFSSAEIHVQYGVFRPFHFQTFHRQAFEQVLLALKISFKGRDQQTLSEPTGAAQEINLVGVSQPVNQLRLVDIHAIIVAQIFKILYPDGIASVSRFHNLTLLICKDNHFFRNYIP